MGSRSRRPGVGRRPRTHRRALTPAIILATIGCSPNCPPATQYTPNRTAVPIWLLASWVAHCRHRSAAMSSLTMAGCAEERCSVSVEEFGTNHDLSLDRGRRPPQKGTRPRRRGRCSCSASCSSLGPGSISGGGRAVSGARGEPEGNA
jgi:hypothetical protein